MQRGALCIAAGGWECQALSWVGRPGGVILGSHPKLAHGVVCSQVTTGIPIAGHISHTNTASTTMSTMLAGIPALKNSAAVNCRLA